VLKLAEQNRSLDVKCNSLTTQLSNLQTTYNRVLDGNVQAQELETLQQQVASLQTEHLQLTNQLAEDRSHGSDLEKRLVKLEKENSTLTVERDIMQETCDDLNREVNHLKTELESRQVASNTSLSEAREVKLELKTIKGEYARLRGKSASDVRKAKFK